MGYSPFLYFTYSNGRNGVSPRGVERKRTRFSGLLRKTLYLCPYEGWGRVRHGQSGNSIFMRLCTRLPWLGFSNKK